jgi:hypothetical protein
MCGGESAHANATTETAPLTTATIVETRNILAPKVKSAMPQAASTPHAARPSTPARHTAKHITVLSRHVQEATAVRIACRATARLRREFWHPCSLRAGACAWLAYTHTTQWHGSTLPQVHSSTEAIGMYTTGQLMHVQIQAVPQNRGALSKKPHTALWSTDPGHSTSLACSSQNAESFVKVASLRSCINESNALALILGNRDHPKPQQFSRRLRIVLVSGISASG